MSTNTRPPPWFSAAKRSRRKRIDWICDLGGSRPPRKPSTRIVAPGPPISFRPLPCHRDRRAAPRSARASARSRTRSPRGSSARSRGSCPTVTSSATLARLSFISRRVLLPARRRRSSSCLRFEPGELRAHGVPSGRERCERRLAALVGHDLDRRTGGLDGLNRDPSVDDDGAGLIGDRDAQRRLAARLREDRNGAGERQANDRQQAVCEGPRPDH